jgi:hypothetical protein
MSNRDALYPELLLPPTDIVSCILLGEQQLAIGPVS